MAADEAALEGRDFRAGLAQARQIVDAFDPELVVMFGSDHRRAYEPVIPAFSVILAAEGYGDHGSPTGAYDIPRELAERLAQHLLAADFDVAASRGVRLDHGFGETIHDLFGSLDARPLLPIFINCATPPLGAPQRSIALGRAVRSFLESELGTQRVLVIGSGGLSHSPPTLEVDTLGLSDDERRAIADAKREAARDRIDPDWDVRLLRMLESDDGCLAIDQTLLDAGGVGANEVRTWLAARSAGGADSLIPLAYQAVPEWITGMGIAISAWAGAGQGIPTL